MTTFDDYFRELMAKEYSRQQDAWSKIIADELRRLGIVSPEQVFVHQSEYSDTTTLYTRISCWMEAP